MHAVALLSAATTAGTTSLPFFHLGALDVGIPIQSFGILVAAGVLIGASLLRRYAEWHGLSDDHIRGLIGWVAVCGFIGAHEFDAIAYHTAVEVVAKAPPGWWFLPDGAWPTHWPLAFRMWDGISSYGGFIGGAAGFACYVWWKRLPPRLAADITVVGLLPAFSIGRIGCTVVSDHIGAIVDTSRWYSFLAMDYPRALNMVKLPTGYAGTGEFVRAWNLGLIELLYLVPVNALILYLAFRRKRIAAGLLVVLTGALYAPVRFYLDFLRPDESDPRYSGLTFAQWASIAAFIVAVAVAVRIFKKGEPAGTIAPTVREAMQMLRAAEEDDDDDEQASEAAGDAKVAAKKSPNAGKPAKSSKPAAKTAKKK